MKRSFSYLLATLFVAFSLAYFLPTSAQDQAVDENVPAAPAEAPVEQSTAPAEAPQEQPAAPAEAPQEQPAAPAEAPQEQPAAPAEAPLEQSTAPAEGATPFEQIPTEGVSYEGKLDEVPEESPESEQSREVVGLAPVEQNWKDNGWVILGAFVAVLVLSGLLAQMGASAWRMPDHAFRFFALLVCLLGAGTATYLGIHRITLGIDLRGGVVLIYDAFPVSGDAQDGGGGVEQSGELSGDTMDALISAIARRVNPGGVLEISIQRLGSNQVKVVIPNAEDAEIARIERIISESGALHFRILASNRFTKDGPIIDAATRETGRVIRDENGRRIAEWTPVDENEQQQFLSGDAITRMRNNRLEVLVLVNEGAEGYDVSGEYLQPGGIGRTFSEGKPAVSFSFNAAGASRFGRLTGSNLPVQGQQGLSRRLGIILNDSLYSAPTIQARITSNGVITFTDRPTPEGRAQLDREINDLINVLNSGALPAKLSKDPVSKQRTGAMLGDDTIAKGRFAMISAGLLVAAFMLVYYRGLGIIACFCVVMNLLMIMAVMLAIRAAFTLPGLAGLVLTVGMAVDANILIFERLREEFASGSSMKMAIRNAFAKATSAIVDSNLTSIITGVILYAVGTEQIKGFAVTLVLGVIFSMYTAIYCSRTVMDVIEKNRWVSRFTMMRLLTKTNINFLGFSSSALVLSFVLFAVGMAAVGARGKGIFGIDFVGGFSAEVTFIDSTNVDFVRSTLNEAGFDDLSVSRLELTAESQRREALITRVPPADNTHFVVTTAMPTDGDMTADEFSRSITERIRQAFGDKLVYNFLEYEITSAAEGAKNSVAMTMCPPMNAESLRSAIDARIRQREKEGETLTFVFDLKNAAEENSTLGELSTKWTLTSDAPAEQIESILAPMAEELKASPYFPTLTTVGGSVAANARTQAVLAVLASLVCIVIYMWFRFQHIIYGLAATLTLVHNVLIVLGFVGLSHYLAPVLGFLQVYEFKIDLTMIAAFLTLIGYSLNDTIILFDRIRENRGKSTLLTGRMINTAINQTLSRTILTSATTFLTTFILYFWGGDGIHSFSFALMAGIVVGTYGSIFIASPLLLWMMELKQKRDADKR